MDKEINKNKYVTEEHLDKKLGEQTQVIITAVDSILNTRLKKTEDNLRSEIYAVRNELKTEIGEVGSGVDRVDEKIDKLQTDIDGLIKKQDDFEEEHVIMKEEVKQMKGAFKDKLGVTIQVI